MKKIILSITFILLAISLTFGQSESEKDVELAKESCEIFFKQIIKKKNFKAYQQLSLEGQEAESVNDFDLKFKKIAHYYGSLKSFKCRGKESVRVVEGQAYAFYSLTFENVQIESSIFLTKDSSDKYKIDYYDFTTEEGATIAGFNEMVKIPMDLLLNKEYESLYRHGTDTFLSYEQFLSDLNTLIKGDKIECEFHLHSIWVAEGKVNYRFNYEINQEGNIIFEYQEENGIPVLQRTHFFLANKVDDEIKIAFQKYLNTELTPAELDTLSYQASLELRIDFELSYFDLKPDSVENAINSNFIYREGHTISIIDKFKTQQENEQLGKDLLAYDYAMELRTYRPTISLSELKGITWQYFIQESNKEVSFRLFLDNDALIIKDDLINFFENSIETHISEHLSQKKALTNAVKLGSENLGYIENNEFETFWNNTSKSFKATTNKDDLFKSLTQFKNALDPNDKRTVMNRQFYNTHLGFDGIGFYVINFNSENAPNRIQQIIFQTENKKLKVIGVYIYGQ